MEQAPRTPEQMPLSPDEAVETVRLSIPGDVYAVFNDQININLENGKAVVYQRDVVEELEDMGYSREEIYGNRWLDVEESYRKVGWHVIYEKPGYCETGPSLFTFYHPSQVEWVPRVKHQSYAY